MLDLTRYESHSPAPWWWRVPDKDWEGQFFEGELPYVVDANGETVFHYGDSTEYYPSCGGFSLSTADRSLATDGPLLVAEVLRQRAEIAELQKRNRSLIETGRKIMEDHTNRTKEAIALRDERDNLLEEREDSLGKWSQIKITIKERDDARKELEELRQEFDASIEQWNRIEQEGGDDTE